MHDDNSNTGPLADSERLLSPTRVRFGVLLFMAAATSSAYLTRYCISVANTTIMDELHFSEMQMGWIFSAFAWGYLIFQVPGGWLGNRFGTRAALRVMV